MNNMHAQLKEVRFKKITHKKDVSYIVTKQKSHKNCKSWSGQVSLYVPNAHFLFAYGLNTHLLYPFDCYKSHAGYS